MLERLARFPETVFHERELRERFPEQFVWATESRLIRHVGKTSDFVGRDSERRTLYETDGAAFVIADGDPDVVFEPVVPSDTVRWSLDLPSVASLLHATNGLDGRVEVLGRLLVFVGHRAATCYLMALTDGDSVGALIDPRPPALSTFTDVVVLIAGDMPKASTAEALRRVTVRCALLPMMNSLEDAAWLIETGPMQTDASAFRHNDDFSWVALGERGYRLSLPRSAVIRRLSQAADVGQHAVPWAELQGIAEGAGGNPKSMKDLLGSLKGWEELAHRVGRDGWRLASDQGAENPAKTPLPPR
jgi:hypothetical protein